MNINELKKDIQDAKLRPVYLFTGEEVGVMDIYINQMSKISGKSVFIADTFLEVYNAIKKSSILKTGYIYIVRDDKQVIQNEKCWKLLDKPTWDNSIVILIYTNLDKRTKFYKHYANRIIEFEQLSAELLKKYIQKKINLSDRCCDKLIEICEGSYSRIMLEVDKIYDYAMATATNKNDINWDYYFKVLLKSGIIYIPPRDAIFLWVDEVLGRKSQGSFRLMQECFDCGEEILVMVTVLYNSVRQVLQVQSNDGKSKTGLTGWQVKCAKPFVGNFSIGELLDIMRMLREMEVGIKTGRVEKELVIPRVLVEMLW